MTDCEARVALTQVVLTKSLGLVGLSYEMYLRLSHMFLPILCSTIGLP